MPKNNRLEEIIVILVSSALIISLALLVNAASKQSKKPEPADLCFLFTKGFNNEEVELRLNGNIIFNDKVKTPDPEISSQAAEVCQNVYVGGNYEAELTISESPFIKKYQKIGLKMEKPKFWVIISQNVEDGWAAIEFRYQKPLR